MKGVAISRQESNRRYYQRNRDELLTGKKNYYQKKREERLAYQRRYDREHAEEKRQYAREARSLEKNFS